MSDERVIAEEKGYRDMTLGEVYRILTRRIKAVEELVGWRSSRVLEYKANTALDHLAEHSARLDAPESRQQDEAEKYVLMKPSTEEVEHWRNQGRRELAREIVSRLRKRDTPTFMSGPNYYDAIADWLAREYSEEG